MDLRAFGHEDVEEAKELSDAAGWNQIASDWHRLIDLQQDGCLGLWADGQLVGTTTFVTYGQDLAWIGMVLVRPAHRGQGFGTRLLQAAMEKLGARSISVVGLDATESGRALYEREGFSDVTPIIRWSGTLQSLPAQEIETKPIGNGISEAVERFDQSKARVDRGPLIGHLINEEDVVGFSARGGEDELKGYMFLRPGRKAWQIGPLVVDHEDAAKQLLRTAAGVLEDRTVIVDAVDDFGFPSLLRAAGLQPSRRLMRMTAPRVSQLLTDPSIVAAVGFEWG